MAGKKPGFGVVIFVIISIAVTGIIMLALGDEDSEPVEETSVAEAADNGIWFQTGTQENVILEQNLQKNNYYIILDGSGSMKDNNKLPTAKTALTKFVSFVPAEANMGLAVFDGSGLSERVPLGADRKQFINAVDRIIANGNTPLDSSLELAYEKLQIQAQKQLGYGEYNIVIVTDGEATSGYEPDRIVNRILSNSPVIIHTIGFQIGEDHSLNQPGKILYKSANNLEELSQGLEAVVAESENFVVTDFN